MMRWIRRLKIRLTYAVTVCHEADELAQLLPLLLAQKDSRDEVVVLQDTTTPSPAVDAVLATYASQVRVGRAQLNGDFATFKNTLLTLATGNYLFQIDADEQPGSTLVQTLKTQLARHHRADCFAVPRANYVAGLTPADVSRWQWTVDGQGRINFPDYQLRLFRLGQDIAWKNRVHEELHGFGHCHYLPADSNAQCLLHRKTIDRQRRQNDYYDSL